MTKTLPLPPRSLRKIGVTPTDSAAHRRLLARDRQRRRRLRLRRGTCLVTLEVDRDALIAAGLLQEWNDDDQEISRALAAALRSWLAR